MKLVNTITAASVSVDDDLGEKLLLAGGWAKSTTTAAKKALANAVAKAERAGHPTGSHPGEDPPAGDPGAGDGSNDPGTSTGTDGSGDAGDAGQSGDGKDAGTAPAKDAGKK